MNIGISEMEALSIIGFIYALLGLSTTFTSRINNSVHKLNKFMLGSSHSLFSFLRDAYEDFWTDTKRYLEEQSGVSNVVVTSNVRYRVLLIANRPPKVKNPLTLTGGDGIDFSLVSDILKNKNIGIVPRFFACAYVTFSFAARIGIYIIVGLFPIFLVGMLLDFLFGLPTGWSDPIAEFIASFMFIYLFFSMFFIFLFIFAWMFSFVMYILELVLRGACYKKGWPAIIIGVLIALPSAVSVLTS